MEKLYYPIEIIESRFEVKGSVFISFLLGYGGFDDFIVRMRKNHSKAVHFVSASRILNTHKQIEESFSDDGEPKGTSGMPTLKVMRGYQLINCGILIVRYFGGTLLGTGGLVRAYTQGAKDVIIKAKEAQKIAPFIPKEYKEIHIDFSHLAQVDYLAKKMDVIILHKEFLANGVRLKIEARENSLEEFLDKINTLCY